MVCDNYLRKSLLLTIFWYSGNTWVRHVIGSRLSPRRSRLSPSWSIGHASGTLVQHENLPSTYCTPRSVQVWLPEGYHENQHRYPVLYMHDGQNLFQKELSWYDVTFEVAEQLTTLVNEGIVRKTIVVGIFCTDDRDREYTPITIFDRLNNQSKEVVIRNMEGRPLSKGYTRFIVKELKPFIDNTYRTKSGQADTFVAGASMGALISLHTLLKYPHIFGGAACLSTHWPLVDEEEALESKAWRRNVTAAFVNYLHEGLPPPGTHRFWFDHGSESLDWYYQPYQRKILQAFEERGYMKGTDWKYKIFPGGDHNEASWRDRLSEPLTFLLSIGKDDLNNSTL